MACDCGPGNALIDDFMLTRLGQPFDQDGQMAAGGMVQEQLLTACLAHPYFKKPLPKSLDRNQFEPLPPELSPQLSSLRDQDVVATLTAFTVESIVKSTELFPQRIQECLVTGGGRHNQTMMRGLSDHLGIPVYPVEHAGWQGDALEAEGFAYLAVRALKGLPLTLPLTTGVSHPLTGGVLFHP
jgi:anhydro-N-acetylmuramic acid kinase